jgi:hypothetical protein
MRKYVVLAALCVAAFAAFAAASASASLVGTCNFHGTATFNPPLNTELKENDGFSFASTAGGALKVGGEGVECVGVNSVTKAPETKAGFANVSGAGTLECVVAKGKLKVAGEAEAEGKLEFPKKEGAEKYGFKFAFVAAGGTVHFVTEGQVTSHGTASFLLSEHQKPQECTSGVSNLEFEATAQGTVG